MKAPPGVSEAPPVERWLAANAHAVALLFVVLGLLARLRAANAPFLQPDEVLHIRIASAATLADTYRESLTNAHPPLFYVLLRGWRHFAHSDWALRLLPVAFGTAFLWSAWRWAAAALGRSSGLVTLACLAFFPSVVVVSSELRGYALLLWAIASALWALEEAFAARSIRMLWLFTGLGAVALSSHYSAFRFLAAAFVYASVRLMAEASAPRRFVPATTPRSFVVHWMAGQAALVALAAFFYATHIVHLRGSPLEQEVQGTWLEEAFRHPGQGAIAFLARRTLSLFQYFFSTKAGGGVALVLFAGGVAWLAVRRLPVAILLTIPFALAAAGGLLAVYPYGGTRHDVDLAILAYSGTAVALARLTGERLWAAVAVAAALVVSGFLVSG
ncbi:MAG TPA: glycosyltransferase family 39 protein [Thermoanaerobaculia bacterium]